uniref:Uncharacterized protein n=1 Tax=Chromera velia CCMP2878 TaxID=1169474 RepID=A0A0G4HN13_9ALVE|eukprot:Cvel_7575.t1-p1 / transcript=Cvel_7575.t1 / gene=Cvel_7575 / organism=Chromera_velia_CCMP2878 / gene_product=Putative uncharacterized hydrolase YOR131C, putative / transcript_product=Putative uncharacterized hydrolase YOR131C, putative / location=Cvel_scaffold399:6611-10548(+) / protein_length=296 / sequence_SO=supercontig / SO=protein_coding / is_pseudo=false
MVGLLGALVRFEVPLRRGIPAVSFCSPASSLLTRRLVSQRFGNNFHQQSVSMATRASAVDPRQLKLILFDMDGTLTLPNAIDFAKMKERLGLRPDEEVLATVKRRYSSDPEKMAEAMQIIDEVESEAAAFLELQANCREMLAALRAQRPDLKTVVVTRNSLKQLHHFVKVLGMDPVPFDALFSRDCFEPVKPEPHIVHHLCDKWGISPAESIFVGDYKDDLLCGRNAGGLSCLISSGCPDRENAFREFADAIVPGLQEFAHLLGLQLNVSVSSDPKEVGSATASTSASPSSSEEGT